jgi:hypothetical protein
MPWAPTATDFQELLSGLNPWHTVGRVPDAFARDKRRPLAADLWMPLLKPVFRRFQVVVGPRRVGKTVSMYQTVQKLLDEGVQKDRLWWLDMSHPLLLNQLRAVKIIDRRRLAIIDGMPSI